MIDTTTYKWLDKEALSNLNIEDEDKIKDFLNVLNDKDFLPGKKNILACYYIDQLSKEQKTSKSAHKLSQKDYQSWYKSASFKKLKEKVEKDDKDKYVISAIVSMMMATLVIYFVKAIIIQNFVISFSIDAIIGCLALILFIRNIRIRYTLIHRYTKSRDILYLDICAVILCVLLKILISVFDLTLIVLFVDYYVTKKKIERQFELFNESFGV